MNISEAAKQTGLTAKAIRLYEEQGLIQPSRSASGYRQYQARDLQDLSFLAHARAMGFGLNECADLMSLYRNPGRASADVKALAQNKLIELDEQLIRLQTLRQSLQTWIDHCPGNQSPDCPIIKQLANTEADTQ